MNPLLSVIELAYAYNGVVALRGVTFEVRHGEIVALLGANGAGKSTTVKTIAGALVPQGGEIRFDGVDITGQPCHAVVRRGITLGASDDLGFNVVKDKVHVHDLHATMLQLLGFDHTKLTYKFQGRPFRLTDVHGEVVEKLM